MMLDESWSIYDTMRLSNDYVLEKIEISYEKGHENCLNLFLQSKENKACLKFNNPLCFKVTDENGVLKRLEYANCEILSEVSLLIIENSPYVTEYQEQSYGIWDLKDIVHYIFLDKVDSVVEILSKNKPELLIL